MSKYKRLYTVKLRMAHYISYSLFDGPCYLDINKQRRYERLAATSQLSLW